MATTPQVSTAVIGAGAWGTAMASLLAGNGQETHLWGRNSDYMSIVASSHTSPRYLPDIPLPKNLIASADLAETLSCVQDVLLVTPSHAFRQTLEAIEPYLNDSSRLMWASKGFEPGTGRLLHEVVDDMFGSRFPTAVISGPTFALEVAKRMPTAVTVASNNHSFAAEIAQRLHSEHFRAYTSSDVLGVEIGGSVKNILAIAAGIADGLGFGANARAALITRGLNEVMRLGEALGGQRETLMGLAGLGDLVLTCTDDQSRNRRFGLALGRGNDMKAARDSIDQVVEGIEAAKEARRVAESLNIEMPIIDQVYQVLYNNRSPHDAVTQLLHREQKAEGL
ncbi:NAD(P)H-dependent glycerol-3-phosphate dehydrogenase [Pseudomonadota bacterium]